MSELYMPVLSHFQNGNVWTASDGNLRYKVTPDQEKLTAEVWEGPWCYEDSDVEDKAEFPLEEAGLPALAAWIEDWAGRMNTRPKRTLTESVRARDNRRAALAEGDSVQE